MFLFLLLYACQRPVEPVASAPTLGAMDMARPGAPWVWRALSDLAQADYQLPPDCLPSGGSKDASFQLDQAWVRSLPIGGYTTWLTPMPFTVTMIRPNYAPYGAKLFIDNEEIPYVNDVEDIKGGGWIVDRGQLRLLRDSEPTGHQLVLKAPELDAAENRLHLARSGLSPAQFVSSDISIGLETRQGLMVPAPGKVAFTITIPEKAQLQFGVAMIEPPVPGEQSDGADVSVSIDGENIWSGGTKPGDPFNDQTLDLAKWAGKKVSLSFNSDPRANNVRDHVIFTSPTIRAQTGQPPRQVLMVGIDTLRYDALSMNAYPEATSPALDKWAEGAIVFDQARGPAPRTRPSFRSALTGHEPITAIRAPVIAEQLQAEGFRTAGFTANVHLVPRFHFNSGFELWSYENGARAEAQISRALDWMAEHKDEDTFVFLHLMDPHTFYDAPGSYQEKFVKVARPDGFPEFFNRWEVVMRSKSGRMDSQTRRWVRGRYDGEVNYVTDQLAGWLAEVERRSPRTLTVVLSDHGEEFWDHDGYEHNHSVYDELVHVLLMIRPPGGWAGGPHRYNDSVGLIDIVPTILDCLGLSSPTPLDGVSLRPFLDAAQSSNLADYSRKLAERPLIQGHLMFDTERWSVVYQGWKYILHTVSGREELYNLTTDPHELHNHNELADRREIMKSAMEAGTGWPVRPAWRLFMQTQIKTPFQVVFTAPVEEAGVIDPEAGRQVRANLEWGERPQILSQDVASVVLSDDHLTVNITPGPSIGGQTLFIACPPKGCPEAQIVSGDLQIPLQEESKTVFSEASLQAHLGTILLQRITEAEELSGTVEGAQIEALKVLGYLEPD